MNEYTETIAICDECREWLKSFSDKFYSPLAAQENSQYFLSSRCTICKKFTFEGYNITMRDLIKEISDESFRMGESAGANNAY